MIRSYFAVLASIVLLSACAPVQSSADAGTTLTIALATGGPLTANAGDVLYFTVVQTAANGQTTALPAGAQVAWSGPPRVDALPSGSMPTTSALPPTGAAPAAMWLRNTEHYTDAELAGVLFVLDAGSSPGGTVTILADVTGAGLEGHVTATLPVGGAPVGDATRGAATYASNCAMCHGPTGHGGGDFPGINAEAGNVASDPDWNVALFASCVRGDVDNLGVSESSLMPSWLTLASTSGHALGTQDFADAYAWLATQQE